MQSKVGRMLSCIVIIVMAMAAGCGGDGSSVPQLSSTNPTIDPQDNPNPVDVLYESVKVVPPPVLEEPSAPIGGAGDLSKLSLTSEPPIKVPDDIVPVEAKLEYVRQQLRLTRGSYKTTSAAGDIQINGDDVWYINPEDPEDPENVVNGLWAERSHGFTFDGGACILSGSTELAYGLYRLSAPDIFDFYPSSIRVNTGAEERYWLMVSNYSAGRWEVLGEYSGPVTVPLYSESASGFYDCITSYTFETYVAVVAWQEDVHINGLTIGTTASDLVELRARKPFITQIKTKLEKEKSASSLDPQQQVDAEWSFTWGTYRSIDTNAFREPYGGSSSFMGKKPSPDEIFTDDIHLQAGNTSPLVGETYYYSLIDTGISTGGKLTDSDPTTPVEITIPVLAPADVSASDGAFEDKIQLTWSAVTAADYYDVYRDDNTGAAYAQNVTTTTWDDTNVSDTASHTYWVKAVHNRTDGTGLTTVSEFSISDDGFKNALPTANFSAPSTGNASFAISFDASGSHDNGDTQGSPPVITKYEWDWDNDGTYDETTTSATTTHKFIDPGSVTVGLRVTDNEGSTDTTTQSITINGWSRTWGMEYYQRGYSAIMDASGNTYFAADYPLANSEGSLWGVLVGKLDSSGDQLWLRAWNNDKSDTVAKVLLDSSGNLIVVGDAPASDGASDILVLRYDPSGNLTLQRTWGYASGNAEWPVDAHFSNVDGDNLIIAGVTHAAGGGNADVLLLHIDLSADSVLSSRWLGGALDDKPSGFVLDDSDNLMLAAYSQTLGDQGSVWLVQLSSAGAVNWEKVWDGSAFDYPGKVVMDSSGNYYVSGHTESYNPYASFLVKVSGSGSLVADKVFGQATPSAEPPTWLSLDSSESNLYCAYSIGGTSTAVAKLSTSLVLYTTAWQLSGLTPYGYWSDGTNLIFTGDATNAESLEWESITISSDDITFSYSTSNLGGDNTDQAPGTWNTISGQTESDPDNLGVWNTGAGDGDKDAGLALIPAF